MNKGLATLIGLVCLAVGGLLIYWGYSQGQSIMGHVNKAVTGSPSNNTMWLYVGGAVLAVVGFFFTFGGRKR